MTFGREMLQHWLLDPSCTYLNHGTVGATPRRVLRKQQELRDEMERQPSQFLLRELNGEQPMPGRTISRLREASHKVAAFIGARADDLVLVSNVTTGLNAVLGSFPLAAGDEVVITDLAYGAIAKTAGVVCARSGATLRTVQIPWPTHDAGDVVEGVVRALTPRTKLVVIDHITARTALILPVAQIAAECHARNVPVLVDGAHVPGAQPLNISALDVDWYAANLHKWAHAPRSCGFLWAAPERQSILHAPVVSWGRDGGYHREFEHTPTTDPTALLAAPEGIALLDEWNLESCVCYMHTLAVEAATLLTDHWHTTFEIPATMVGTMVTVPLPQHLGSTDTEAARLRLSLLLEDKIEVQLHASHNRLWVRVSAQIYNDQADLLRLANAITRR